MHTVMILYIIIYVKQV